MVHRQRDNLGSQLAVNTRKELCAAFQQTGGKVIEKCHGAPGGPLWVEEDGKVEFPGHLEPLTSLHVAGSTGGAAQQRPGLRTPGLSRVLH